MKDQLVIRKLRIHNAKISKVFGYITFVCTLITSVAVSLQGFLREYIKTDIDEKLISRIETILRYSYPALVPISIITAIGVLLFKVIDVEEIAKVFSDLENQIEKLNKFKEKSSIEIESQASQQAAILGGITALELILGDPNNFQDETEALKRIINPLILVRDKALRFNNGGFYNFVVYKFDKTRKLLSPVFRDYDKRIEVHNREWAPGQGHIGFSFQQDGPVIHSDINSIRTIQAPKGKYFESDNIYYKSFISTPIIGGAENVEDRIGVFVITSSADKQFDNSHKFLANCYAILINLYYTEIKKSLKRKNDGKANISQESVK